MRMRVRRLLGVSALYLLFGLNLPGCSGQQQEEDGLEVSGQENQENADGQEADGNTNAEGYEDMNESNNGEENSENGDESADAGDATENDLQEIIQEMNGQQTADSGDSGDAMALQQDTAAAGNMGSMPMESAPMESAPMAEAAPAGSSMPFQPGGSPAAPGLPEAGSKMGYIVESGDTLGKISQKIYGTPGRWNELATLSGIANPSRIYPGDLVYYTLDESAVSFATAYESIQRSTESVQQGDTLATIAQRVYGSSKAWRSIWRHNDKIDNPDILTAGTAIYFVPKGAATAAVNKIKSNIAQVSTKSIKATKKVAKSFAKKAKTLKVSNVNTFASITNVFSTGLMAAI